MEKDKGKLPVLEAVDERFGDVLSASLRQVGAGTDQCPSPENIAALVDGKITGQKRDEIMKHISSCDACCETFILAAELRKETFAPMQAPKERSNIIFFRPLALAASILIVAISIYLFFKTDAPKTSRQLLETDESTVSRDAAQPQPTLPKAARPTPGKYSMPGAVKEAPAGLKKGAPISAGERRLEDSTTKKADKKFEFSDRKDHFKMAEKKEKQKVEEKVGRIQTQKTVPGEEALKLDETRERTKPRGEPPTALQKAGESPRPAPEKMKVAAPTEEKEQAEQIQGKGQTVTGSLEAQPGTVDNEKLAALQKNRAWSQANLINQQSQLARTYSAGELQEMFRNTVDLTRQLKQEYERLMKEAQKTGDFAELDAFMGGVAPLITIKTSKNVSSIYPNIGYFLSMSAPGSVEHRFFSLARSGWCEPKVGCSGMETAIEPDYRKNALQTASKDKDISDDQLMQWKALQPKLSGVFQEVAQYTIENIKQQQRVVPVER
jgi:hypothetical protein